MWRFAPRRLLHDPLSLALMVGVLTMVGVAASAGPLYAEAVSDASLRTVLGAVPAGAGARDAAVARVNGGIDPSSAQWSDLVTALDGVGGLDTPRVTSQSVSTELHSSVFYNPVGPTVTGPAAAEPVRIFGVDDPASRLVVLSRVPGANAGVWLSEPVAASTGVAAGDQVRVQLSGIKKTPTARARVVGTYAVGPDGRTPLNPPGQRLWSELSAEAFPSDAGEPTQRAQLAVTDLPSAATLAKKVDDQLLWSAQSRLDPAAPRLTALHRTAAEVAELRRGLASRSDLVDSPVTLRPAVVSGIEELSGRADLLADVAQRGTAVTTRLGIGLALALAVAAAAYSMGRRRREVQLAAGTGRRPVSAGLLYVVELLPAALVAGVLGWFGARALVATAVGSITPSRPVLTSAATWCGAALVAALAVSGAVAAVATRVETRRLEGRPDVRVPWVLVLVVLAASATVGLLTRPPRAGDPLGPLDILVPPLVAAAVAAVGATLFFGLLRRLRSSSRPPTRRTVAGWLARRRLQAPDRGREATTTIAATGLAMLVFSFASLVSLQDTVEDRAAVAVGADTVDRVGPSSRLDPEGPVQAPEPADGSPLPVRAVPAGRNPSVPPGQSVAWRAQTSVATSDRSVNLLVIDPLTFAGAAAWGSPGGPVAAGRDLLPALATADAAAVAKIRRDGVGYPVPALLVGRLGDLDLAEGSTLTVDTLNLAVQLQVSGVLDAFPGSGNGAPTLVLPADSFFAAQFNEDPRLRPAPGAPRNRPVEFQADLWSSSGPAAAATLAAAEVDVKAVGTLAQARATPVYVAAAQARRYQIALGLVFGALGLSAVALAAVRLARRSPAADRMLAWTGAGRRTPGRARSLEVAVVLVLTAGLAVLGLLALRPLARILLEPGDGLAPEAVLQLPLAALAAGGAWLLVAALASLAGMALATGSQPAVEVLRGED